MLATGTKATAAPATDPQDAEVGLLWKQIAGPLEPFLETVTDRLAEQVRAFDPELIGLAEYTLQGQGKRLRPCLVGLVGQALGKITDDHVKVAVIIEMVHLATLVHDDVMDEAALRRGRRTVAAQWGNETAVLFGDCLFAQALRWAASFPTPEVCRAVAHATQVVCTGEILQTRYRRNFPLSYEHYDRILAMKTGELFALACDLGAWSSGADSSMREVFRRFGLGFGTAYQLYDDCLDLIGEERFAGKSLGTDLAKGKLTLPVLLAWYRADLRDRARLESWISQWDPSLLPRLRELLERYQAIPAALAKFHEYLERACYELHQLPSSLATRGLVAATEYLARQTVHLTGRV
ncbi:MAG: polyprenyl synthetase family protein [Verrucomicrobiota bacterium]|nr:polyprenyl synthetase family protein [Limisphaera sp.]MDW8382377.1 polyprenyl synthetase family protein [Verrucomicrobiota bacterium]